jgi:hypothetical protein
MNPLWIVSLFLGLAEITVGVVATQVQGWIQGLLAIFATGFPVGIAAAFFAVLWRKPYVFYAPKDYPKHVSAPDYITALQAATVVKQEATETAVLAAIRVAVREAMPADLPATTAQPRFEAAVEAARHEFSKNLVTVDLTEFSVPLAEVMIPVSEQMRAADFLNEIWLNIADQIDPFTYGTDWGLREIATGQMLLDKSITGRRQEKAYYTDRRTLKDVGIHGGATFRVVDLRAPAWSRHR